MDVSSVKNLCKQLISSAIHRCRVSGELCRLTVNLKSFPCGADNPVFRVSISDTGVGSNVDEFQYMQCLSGTILNEIQDGVISIATTSVCDHEIFHYNIDLKQNDYMKRLAKLPLSSKNGASFSGTEVSFSTFHCIDDLQADITCFFKKFLIMKVPKTGIELIVDKGEIPVHQCINAIIVDECIDLSSEENVPCLKSGLMDYVLKHGNQIDSTCHSCFPIGERLKCGSGLVCKSNRNTETTIEAVVIISELAELMNPSCSSECGSKTEVLYFSDYSPGVISQSLLNELKIIDWKSYGLIIKCISDVDGCVFIEWEDLPPGSHVDIAIHCHHKKYPFLSFLMFISSEYLEVANGCLGFLFEFVLEQVNLPPTKASTANRNLAKKAVKSALNDLKEKNDGFLLSANAVKIRSYAPDLAKTIAGLILTSNDSKFRGDCASLLGLHSHDEESIEDNIKQRLLSVIDRNDREPQTKRIRESTFLFNDDYFDEPEYADEEYENGEISFSAFDL